MNTSLPLLPGDLIFQNTAGTETGQAIRQVWQGWNGRAVTHVSLVLDRSEIIEAVPPAVRIEGLADFLHRTTAPGQDPLLIGRPDPRLLPLLKEALEWVRRQEGLAYNHHFLPDSKSWYCSELVREFVHRAGAPVTFLPPTPLNFCDPDTGHLLPYWEEYYRNLGHPVPQGLPGSHPAAQSLSRDLHIFILEEGTISGDTKV